MQPSHTKVLKVLRAAHERVHEPIRSAEAALTRAEAVLTRAQQEAVKATELVVVIDRTAGSMIDPMRLQAQAAYDDAAAAVQSAQAAVTAARTALIAAYGQSARAAYESYAAAMQSVDPTFLDALPAPQTLQPESVSQPSLFPEKPTLRGPVESV